MFSLSEKLKFMFLAGLLAFAGFLYGSMNSDTQAQSGSETIDELTVRKLTVLQDITVTVDNGERRVIIDTDENGGRIMCLAPETKPTVGVKLSTGKMGGVVGVRGTKGSAASFTTGKEGGRVNVFAATGKGAAALGIFDGDGVVFTIDKFGQLSSSEQ